MSKQYTQKEISQIFKNVFESPDGSVALEKIKMFCLANAQQSIADTTSTNQTFYNLGANSVYRYIQYWMDMKFEETKDCVIETEG